MDELIQEVIRIEEKAKAFLNEGERSAQKLEEKIDHETEVLEQEIKSRAADKCKSLKVREETEAQEKIEKIEAHTAEQIRCLEEKYKARREQWIDDVFKAIVSL